MANSPENRSHRTRRLMAFMVSPELLLKMGQGQYRVVADEIPEDATLAWAYHDAMSNSFVCVIESEEFDEVPHGWYLTFLSPPWIERIHTERVDA